MKTLIGATLATMWTLDPLPTIAAVLAGWLAALVLERAARQTQETAR